jgi:predicted PurR-regulated permease PerM
MITILIIIISVLILLCIFLVIRGISLVSQNESLRNILIEYIDREEESKKNLNIMLEQMREIDIKGSFESDDEVGVVFSQLKNLIEEYNKN